MTILEARKSRW